MKDFYRAKSVEDTWAVARELAAQLEPGDIVCLEGDLGAGKTTFTQALAAQLGAVGRVASPTFCIVREHPIPHGGGKSPSLLVHMDLYRLSGEDDVEAIGWDDYLSKGAVIVVEWPERAASLIPDDAYHVVFRRGNGEEDREISLSRRR